MQKHYQLRQPETDVTPVIRALSIKQPWAWLILRPDLTPEQREAAYLTGDIKDFENRTWATQFRGQFLVHASRQPVPNWREICKYMEAERGIVIPESAECGGIVGVASIVDCIDEFQADHNNDKFFWFQGPFALKLAHAQPFDRAIPYSGKLGFFSVPIAGPVKEALEKLTNKKHGIVQ